MPTRLATAAVLLALIACAATWAEAQPAASPPKRTLSAASESATAEERLRTAVRRAVAAYFGVRVEDVSDSTDLMRDLHADAMDAYEVLAMLCREQGVVAPARDDLVTVRAIVDYLRTAPRAQPAVAERGWATRPGSAGTRPEKVVARKIFYATDRARADRLSPERYFGDERQAGNRLNYGTCEVTIPAAAHHAGQTEEPAWYRLEWEGDPAKHFILKSVRPLERAAFFAEVGSSFQGKPTETFVFIHGYNVSFSRAARRTAQIAYDLDFQGIPILFSWPSAAKLTAYFSDRENAEWSAAHLARFLEELSAETPRERLHLLAHSMGNQTLIRALADIAARRGPAEEPLFENVVLAAPDFDAQLFLEQIAPRVIALARHWTLYASDKDRALDAATTLSARRLGLPLPIARGFDTVDASGIDVAPWSVPEFHTYFASKQRVISDLAQVLRGKPPRERKLQSRSKDGSPYWILAPL